MASSSNIVGKNQLAVTGSTGNNTHASYEVRRGEGLAVGFQFVVEAIGGTPTITYKFQGSYDNTNFYDVLYITDSSDTPATTARTVATVSGQVEWLSKATDREYRYYRCVTTANTNVTYRAELWCENGQMATTAAELIRRSRRYLRDFKDADVLTAALTDTTGTTVTVADTALYAKRWAIEVDSETMIVRAIASATTLTVTRGAFGSTAATHSNGASILVRPEFYSVEILDALNEGMDAAFPYIYKPVSDTSLTAIDSTYEYAIPNMTGRSDPIPILYRCFIKIPGDLTYREIRRWETVRGGTAPIIKFRSSQPGGSNFRLHGYGGFTHFAATTDALDAQWPYDAEYVLPIYAAGSLLMSGEAGRVRVDTGAVDTREQAQRTGASLAVGAQLLARFQREITGSAALPPLPRHAKVTV